MANEVLNDGLIARIVRKMSSKDFKRVAVTGMKIEQTDLDNITTSANGDQQEVMRELLGTWRNKTGAKVQVLK